MKNAYCLFLVFLGLVVIIFNRFAVDEAFKILPVFPWTVRSPEWLARIVTIVSGTFFVLFGLLMMMGYLQ